MKGLGALAKHAPRIGVRVTQSLVACVILLAVVVAAACGAQPDSDTGGSGADEQQEASGDPYVIGVSAHLTGAGAQSYRTELEGARVYFEWLNSRGGIDGHPVELEIRDNRGEPATASSDAQYFTGSDAHLVLLLSSSRTVPGWSEVIKDSSLVNLNMWPCYGPASTPPIGHNFFCAGTSPVGDSHSLLEMQFEIAQSDYGMSDPTFAFFSSDAPGNMAIFTELIIPQTKERGFEVATYEAAPFGTSDYTPFARSIIESGADVVTMYTLTEQALSAGRTLRELGFEGPIVSAQFAELSPLADLEDPDIWWVSKYSPVSQGKPVHENLQQAAEEYGAEAPVDDLQAGWIYGIAAEQALAACGWPCDPEELANLLNDDFTVDSQAFVDLFGGPLTWTESSHIAGRKGYLRVHWDDGISAVGDWVEVEDPGLVFE